MPVATAPAAVAKLAKPAKRAKVDASGKKKAKLVRDSFTMPESAYAIFGAVKKRCLAMGVEVKKSEVLRAALASFHEMSDKALTEAIRKLEAIKTGRPPKAGK